VFPFPLWFFAMTGFLAVVLVRGAFLFSLHQLVFSFFWSSPFVSLISGVDSLDPLFPLFGAVDRP